MHPRKQFHGQTFAISFGLYALLRFGLEFLRADDRGIYGGLATSQWISLGMLAFCAFVWARASAHARSEEARQTREAAAL